MIKFQATAKVHQISPVLEIPSKTGGNPFQKRELILDDSFAKDGQTYTSHVLVEFTGDKMPLLDGFAPGQLVNVEGVINGRAYNGRVFNTVKGTKISPFQSQQTAPPQGAYPPPQQYPPQQPQYPGQPQPSAPQQYPPQQGGYNPNQQGGYNPGQPYVPGNPIGAVYPPNGGYR